MFLAVRVVPTTNSLSLVKSRRSLIRDPDDDGRGADDWNPPTDVIFRRSPSLTREISPTPKPSSILLLGNLNVPPLGSKLSLDTTLVLAGQMGRLFTLFSSFVLDDPGRELAGAHLSVLTVDIVTGAAVTPGPDPALTLSPGPGPGPVTMVFNLSRKSRF